MAAPAPADAAWYARAMGNAYGITLDDASLRWAAAESVPETVIAAICLLRGSVERAPGCFLVIDNETEVASGISIPIRRLL